MSVLRMSCRIAAMTMAASGVVAAELNDCVQFSAGADGAAQLTNVCSDRLNMMYCVDNDASPRACARHLGDVITLNPGSVERIPTYANDGRGQVHWGICVYPTAPVNWQPGAAEVTCKKTCVMC